MWANDLQVLVDGCDVRDMELHCLRSQVGLVSQEPVLFSCTVRENICYGNPEATQEEVEKAAQAANAHSFISRLPEGYSTQVLTCHLVVIPCNLNHEFVAMAFHRLGVRQ